MTVTANMVYISIYLVHQVLVAAHRVLGLHCSIQDLYLQHVGASSLTGDQTQVPCIRSAES